MADANDLLNDWIGKDPEKTQVFATNKAMVVRWLNEANQRYCDKAEVIRDIWTPTIDSTGKAPLPDDWLREIKDRVVWAVGRPLKFIEYSDAIVRQYIGTYFYAIWMHTFYVFAPATGSPTVPYIRRPDDITTTNLATYELDIHREDHWNLAKYLDSRWARHKGDVASALVLEKEFDEQAVSDGQDIRDKYQPLPVIRGNWF